jgi:hypothetical protein
VADLKLKSIRFAAWQTFNFLVNGCLGNEIEGNYKQIVEELMRSFSGWDAGCPHSHLNFIP